jgi:hypothetical protein
VNVIVFRSLVEERSMKKKDIIVHLYLSIAHVAVFAVIRRKKRIIMGYRHPTTHIYEKRIRALK